jgi:effector-binding domain-containing protein
MQRLRMLWLSRIFLPSGNDRNDWDRHLPTQMMRLRDAVKEVDMLSEPRIVERQAQPYLAIPKTVTFPFGTTASKTLAELQRWMRERGIEPADPLFIKYNVIDMSSGLEVEFGAPTSEPVDGDETVINGVLPEGRYAFLTHTGPYEQLRQANGVLLEWIAAMELPLDMHPSPAGDVFGCRLEIYPTDPEEESDPEKWVTELAFKLAG